MKSTSITILPTILCCKFKKPMDYEDYELLAKPFPPILSSRKRITKPLLNTSAKSYPKMDKKLVLRGYKYFTRVVSSGEMTVPSLKEIWKSSQIKLIKHFEFDPYFTEASGIKPLARIFNKIMMIKSLKLVIRRFESKHETTILAPFFRRLLRLERLCVELVRIPNVNENDIIEMNFQFLKCYSVKSLEYQIVHLPNIEQRTFREAINGLKHLHFLEDFKVVFFLTHTKFKFYDDVMFSFPKLKKLKRIRYLKGSDSEWTSMTGGNAEFLPSYLRSFSNCPNLVEFTYRLEKINISAEALIGICEAMSKLPKIRLLDLELYYCSVDELELMVFAMGLAQITHLKTLIFKTTQSPNIETDSLCRFSECISTQKNLENFDLVFTKMKISEMEMNESEDFLSKLTQVQSTLKRGSAHIFRRLPTISLSNYLG